MFPICFICFSLPFSGNCPKPKKSRSLPTFLQEGKAHHIQPGNSSAEPCKLEASWPRQQRLNDNGMACARLLLTVYGSRQLQPVRPSAAQHPESVRLPPSHQGPCSLPGTQPPAPGALIRCNIPGASSPLSSRTVGLDPCPASKAF